jgi:hypothetical protein
MIGNYPSLSVSLAFLVVSLPPRFSFALVFFNIMITMIDIRRLITVHVSDGGDAEVASHLDRVLKRVDPTIEVYSLE